jgi:glycine oxidase
MTRHTAIIGGGVIGLSIAWELARRGDQVTLYERNRIGRATSWTAGGILPPANFDTATDPIDRLRGFSHSRFPDWVNDLQETSGIDVGLRSCGGWYLADRPGERAAMLGMADYWQDLDIHCESVPLATVAQQEPSLAHWTKQDADATAWWVPDEFQIRPPRLLQALTRACRQAGVQLKENCPVDTLNVVQGRCKPSADGQSIVADSVIVCGGAWSGKIASSLRLQSSLIPVRGQILLLKTDQPLLRSIVNFGNRYILCRDDGHTIVGSCEEEVGFELGTTQAMIGSLYRFATSKIPALAAAVQVSDWSGLRPMTFDGFPMIGRVPETENLFLASGHYRSGIHLSPATAICLADLIEGKPPPVDLDAFRIAKQQHHWSGNVEGEI